MSNYIFKDADIVRKQIEALKALYPEITEDADLMADMLEGETRLELILESLVEFVKTGETMASAIKMRKDDLADRQKRYERQVESGRAIILQLMEAAEVPRVTLPEATLSVTSAREKVSVVNVDELPQGFFKTERKPLSKEIMAAFKSGQNVPGAELVMGDCSLTIRSK